MTRPLAIATRQLRRAEAAPRPRRLDTLRPIRLDQLSTEGRTDNNFDLLRLFAALCVLLGHSFDLLGQPEPFPNLAGLSWGALGVMIFFSISGFLVARSWDYNPRVGAFAAKRALRLMPGLIAAVLLSALVLGPLVTSEPVRTYLSNQATRTYILRNLTLQGDYTLPGVFAHNVYPFAVNGSLWTLPLEVKSYLILAVASVVGALIRRREVIVIVATLAVLVSFSSVRASLPGANHFAAFLVQMEMSPKVVNAAAAGAFTIYGVYFASFAIGAALYVTGRWIPLLWPLATILAVGLVGAATRGGNTGLYAFMIATPYLVLCFAYRTTRLIRLPSWMGDYSYGIYIYAFPIQQTVSQLLSPVSGWLMWLVATPVTLSVAALSWHFVEKPMLGLKRNFGGSTAGRAAPDAAELRPVDVMPET